jgi:hypothetical protein
VANSRACPRYWVSETESTNQTDQNNKNNLNHGENNAHLRAETLHCDFDIGSLEHCLDLCVVDLVGASLAAERVDEDEQSLRPAYPSQDMNCERFKLLFN